jgi:PEP-CTERM motif
MRIATVLLALASAGCSQIAMASTITEFNRASFQAALSSAMLSGQNFDSLPLGTIVTVNGVTYTPSLGAAVVTNSFLTSTFPNGLGSDSLGFFGADETLTILFSSAITAFALDINTFATNSGDYQATVNDGSGSVVPSLLDVFPNTETGQFIGFTDSSPFTSVVISPVSDPGTGGGHCGSSTCSYTVDTLVYGDAAALSTPEPATWAMMLLGFAGLGFVGYRASRKSAGVAAQEVIQEKQRALA